ncbi:MAG: response regulator transcription factor [Acidobacteriia bacterium]|nr:response regulator transcription factor [Terriglobia bacterium]
MESRKIRVLAVDHNPLLREGLSLLIQLQPDMDLVAAVASAKEAVEAFTEHRPDITLMDLDLPSATGIIAIQEIRGIDPAACIIGMMTYEDAPSSKRALGAGARHCLTKDRLNEDLAPLMRDCMRRAG